MSAPAPAPPATSDDLAPPSVGLVACGVAVSLGGRRVLDGVDLRVAPGELVGLIGPNGAGKTTLLRALLGLVPLDEGEVHLDGAPVARQRTTLGYVPQRHEFAWDFPVDVAGAVLDARTAARPPWRRADAEDRAAVAEALARVGLGTLAARPVAQLSGGQRQRVLLARALARRPRLLLLDEPFTGVDVPTQQVLTDVITDVTRDGGSVLLTTHDLPAAMLACSRICLIRRRVVADGTPAELAGHPAWEEAFGVPALARTPLRGTGGAS